MTHYSDIDRPPERPVQPYLPIPLHKPFFTYVLLVAIGLVWGLTNLAGGSTNNGVLIRFGAIYGPAILDDNQIWRLFTAMFLHVGLTHLLFNAYALFIFGLEMERLYGPDRFIVIYVLAGLFGSLASFAWRGDSPVVSAGASGAIFGVIGMNLAFFLIHRESFGEFGRSRVMSTLIIIVINIAFGLSVRGIDNMAHLGGLIGGFTLGYGLAPRYQLIADYTAAPRLIDTITWANRGWIVVATILILSAGVWTTILVWQ